jgi:hypothetical protein
MTAASTDRLERHAFLMLFASFCGHIGNYAFHALTGRMLPLQDYGLLIAVLGALHILNLPLTALNMAVAQNTADRPGHARAMLAGGSKIFTAASLLSLLLLWGMRRPVQDFFASEQPSLIPITGLLIGLSLFLTLTGGILQGLQKFRWLAGRSMMLFLLRALLCAGFLFGLGTLATTALLAHLLAMAATLGLSLIGILKFTPMEAEEPELSFTFRPVWIQTLKALPALAGFAVLMTADVVLVRRYFPPETSGRFAQAATLARMVLWLPLPVAAAMFPKVITPGAAARKTLIKASVYTAALLLLTLAGFLLFTPLFLRVLYGTTDAELVSWSRRMALAMAPLGFTNVLLQFRLAQKRFALNGVLLMLALAYVTAVSVYHPDVEATIMTLTLANILSTVILVISFTLTEKKPIMDA